MAAKPRAGGGGRRFRVVTAISIRRLPAGLSLAAFGGLAPDDQAAYADFLDLAPGDLIGEADLPHNVTAATIGDLLDRGALVEITAGREA